MFEILILLILWLTSCGVSLLVGFFVARAVFKSLSLDEVYKNSGNKDIQYDEAELKKAEKAQRELYNMLTYDGSIQEPFD